MKQTINIIFQLLALLASLVCFAFGIWHHDANLVLWGLVLQLYAETEATKQRIREGKE